MNFKKPGRKLLLAVVLFAFPVSLLSQNSHQREVALTFDDLPAASANSMTGSEIVDMTTKLVTTLHDQKVPAVGFVNENYTSSAKWMIASRR
jgi:peptidoglycan/xylan/chitin deacetylase (PgdA/CDA1 family)